MRERAVPAQDSVLLIDDDELVAGSLRESLVRGGSQFDVALELSSPETLPNPRPAAALDDLALGCPASRPCGHPANAATTTFTTSSGALSPSSKG